MENNIDIKNEKDFKKYSKYFIFPKGKSNKIWELPSIKGIKYDFAFSVYKKNSKNELNAFELLNEFQSKVRNKFTYDCFNYDVKLVYFTEHKNCIRFYLKDITPKQKLKKCKIMKAGNAYAIIGKEIFEIQPSKFNYEHNKTN